MFFFLDSFKEARIREEQLLKATASIAEGEVLEKSSSPDSPTKRKAALKAKAFVRSVASAQEHESEPSHIVS